MTLQEEFNKEFGFLRKPELYESETKLISDWWLDKFRDFAQALELEKKHVSMTQNNEEWSWVGGYDKALDDMKAKKEEELKARGIGNGSRSEATTGERP